MIKIEQLILECFLGALTGYITNDIALKQLFRDGGVIEQEKDEFIEALVDLVQNEVFTKQHITQILDKSDVKIEISRLVEKFFTELIEEAFNGVRLKDFPHHEEAKLALVCYLNDREGEHDSLINTDGIYKNLLSLIQTGALGEAIDTLLAHLATESLKEAIGDSRYENYVKHRVNKLFEYSDHTIEKKLEDIYQQLVSSELKISDYISFSAEAFSEKLIITIREACNEEQLDRYIKYFANAQESKSPIASFSHTFTEKILTQMTDLFLGHFSKKEKLIKNLVIDSVKEATDDLGDSIQNTFLNPLENFFAPNWLRRESLSFIKKNKLRDYLLLAIPEIKSRGIKYLFSETFENRVRVFCDEIWDLPLCKVFERYINKSTLPSNLKNITSFFIESFLNLFKERGLVNKIETAPLGLWLLTPKIRHKLRETVILLFDNLANGTFDSTILHLEEKYGWKKSLNEQLVDVLSNQDLGKLYHCITTPAEKNVWIKLATSKTIQFLEKNLGEMTIKVTKNYLVSLEQKEIRQIVNDLLGKEMRPLSLVGGVIGFITGLGLGFVTNQESFDANGMLDLGLRSMTYGAIGYGTNVLAINSLFKPYKKKLGWQGLLPKNKYRFARKMGYMTECYIADENIWQGYLSKFNLEFDKRLDNGFSRLSLIGLLNGNDSIKLSGAWLNHPLSDFLKERIGNGLTNIADDGIKLILKDKRFKNGFENLVKTWIIPHLSQNFYNYTEKASDYLWDAFKGKGISELDKTLLIYLDSYFDRGFDSLRTLGEEILLEKIDEKLKKIKLPSESIFYETLIDKMMFYYDYLLPFLQRYEKALAKILLTKVKGQLGFRASIAYRMMGGDRYVLRALNIFLYKKLPRFLDEEKAIIRELLIEYYKKYFMQKSFLELGLTSDNIYIQKFVKKLFDEREKEKFKLNLILQIKEKVIVKLRVLAKNETIFIENLNSYFNLSKLGKEMEKILMPKIEKLLMALQDEVLSYVLTSHIKELFPNWAKNIAQIIGTWRVRTILNEDRLKHIEAVLNGKGVLPDNRFKLAIETYLYDATKHLHPKGSKLLIEQTKPLLQAFDFPSMATYAVDKKDAQALELMIRQIANPYFKRVERMGLLGAVVAVPSSLLSRLFL